MWGSFWKNRRTERSRFSAETDAMETQLGCEGSDKPGGEEDTVMGEADLAGGQADQAMDGERRA